MSARSRASRRKSLPPNQRGDIDREERVGEERMTDPHVGGDGAAEIACQHDRSENRGARNHIENDADKQDDPEAENNALRISKLNGCLHDWCRLNQFHDPVHEKEQRSQGAHDPSGPEGDCDGRQWPAALKGTPATGFTNSEERAAGLTDVVPFLLETRMRELGAVFEGGPDFEPFIVTHGRLITGQNPASAAPLARSVLEVLRNNAS